jgi:hypothetical protein
MLVYEWTASTSRLGGEIFLDKKLYLTMTWIFLDCRPVCELFGADLAYSAEAQGLETDLSHARLLIACTHEVILCSECVAISGPSNARITDFTPDESDPGHLYHIEAVWDESYRGIVRFNMENAR